MISNAESMRFLSGICETGHQRREGGESGVAGQRSGAGGRLAHQAHFRAWHKHVMRVWHLVMGTNHSSWGLGCHLATARQRTICHSLWKKALTLHHSKALNTPHSAASPPPSPEKKDFLLMVLGPFASPETCWCSGTDRHAALSPQDPELAGWGPAWSVVPPLPSL